MGLGGIRNLGFWVNIRKMGGLGGKAVEGTGKGEMKGTTGEVKGWTNFKR